MSKIIKILKIHWKGVLVITLVIAGVIFSGVSFLKDESAEETIVESAFDSTITKSEESEQIEEFIYVDVKGAVKKPGVYALSDGSRVINAIEKSGGLSKGADTSVVNLSKKLEDGDVIIIYSQDKIEEMQKQEVIIEYIEKECICPDVNNDACISKDDIEDTIIDNKENTDNDSTIKQDKVSINSATEEQLTTLPGIGSAKAQDIIDYRKQNGEFKSIEDIKNVNGIGDALFEKIKEHIMV